MHIIYNRHIFVSHNVMVLIDLITPGTAPAGFRLDFVEVYAPSPEFFGKGSADYTLQSNMAMGNLMKSPIHGCFNGEIIYKWGLFNCHIWLAVDIRFELRNAMIWRFGCDCFKKHTIPSHALEPPSAHVLGYGCRAEGPPPSRSFRSAPGTLGIPGILAEEVSKYDSPGLAAPRWKWGLCGLVKTWKLGMMWGIYEHLWTSMNIFNDFNVSLEKWWHIWENVAGKERRSAQVSLQLPLVRIGVPWCRSLSDRLPLRDLYIYIIYIYIIIYLCVWLCLCEGFLQWVIPETMGFNTKML